MFSPKITVIIPTFRRAALIAAAVESVRRQTYPAERIIVVDDGSFDGTEAAVATLTELDRRVEFIQMPENKGACTARNLGVQAAETDWVAFLDSDDRWDANKLEHQVAALSRTPEAVAAFTGLRMEFDGGFFDHLPPSLVTAEDVRRLNVLASTSSALVRRDALVRVGGFDPDLPSCQDWDLWLRLVDQGPVVTVPAPLVFYDARGCQRISRSREKVMRGHAIVFGRVQGRAGSASERKMLRAHHTMRLAELHVDDFAEHLTGIGYAVRSVWQEPSKELSGRFLKLIEKVLRVQARKVRAFLRRTHPVSMAR